MTLVEPAAMKTVGKLSVAASLRGTIKLPSDKSIAHRALICAALAEGPSRIEFRQPGADVLSTMEALRSLGVEIRAADDGDVFVVAVTGQGDAQSIGRLGSGVADCGNSGTSMRLLGGALASGSGTAKLVGDTSLSRRPMRRIADPLRAMGAEVGLTDGHAPVVVSGHRPLRALDHRLVVASAQVLAAICLAALAAEGTTSVSVPVGVRDHSERMLRALRADIERSTDSGGGTTTTIKGPAGLQPLTMRVPGDFSSAAAWIVAASIHPDAELTLADVGLNPTRTALIDVLREMGADITATTTDHEVGEPRGEILVRGGRRLRGIALGAPDVPPIIDELPLLAVAMAAADGESQVRDAAELRSKESDRIAAMAEALTAVGARVDELSDGWRISAGRPTVARIATRGDHRIAMALAVAAWTGVAAAVEMDDPGCVAVSYPSFWEDARSVGAIT